MLITNLAVETPEQALEKRQWYPCRRQIEVFFKVLNSGCRIQQLQLQKRERLEPAIAFYLIIAWRVLFLTHLGRTCPDMPCDNVFDEAEWKAVYLVTQRRPPPETPPSLDTLGPTRGLLGRISQSHRRWLPRSQNAVDRVAAGGRLRARS
ncbi:hypothetical protein Atep_10580 [Allochromatium tepidum]|uniref:Transposase Tn5 dimerisation domain-containing protein n=1 Tax=Allochromatium tepidum TaxID=553982 RepID=A0ABM7QKR0_9GAMM|nr:hypothetical protein Atep_10580 [Allochromatium tepidum]